MMHMHTKRRMHTHARPRTALAHRYYTNGNNFEGTWVMGKKRGHGRYTYMSGEVYIGEMGGARGYKHGYGTLYNGDGTVKQDGQWHEGVFRG